MRVVDTADMAAAVWTACTKSLVYRKKTEPWRELILSGAFAVLRAFLKGVLEKAGVSGWYFVVKLW